jgi:hypothetical protein
VFLNEALAKLKNLKSKAARTEKLINECAVHFIDETPEFSYEDEMRVRSKLQLEILDLKSKIQQTNATTMVHFDGRDITLSELVLINANLRIEMAFLNVQSQHTASETNRYSSRTKDDVKKVLAQGCDKAAFRRKIEALEVKKQEVESIMAAANAATQLK